MCKHVISTLKEEDNGIYLLWTVDASILMFEGLVMGLEDSGFKIKVDYADLFQYINTTMHRLVKPDNYLFPVTKVLAILVTIPIGTTVYLLRVCNGS
jgi:hypothetical protein